MGGSWFEMKEGFLLVIFTLMILVLRDCHLFQLISSSETTNKLLLNFGLTSDFLSKRVRKDVEDETDASPSSAGSCLGFLALVCFLSPFTYPVPVLYMCSLSS